MKVIGVGDNVVDKYIHLEKMFPGGNALNFSVYANKLGFNSSYIGVFGNDKAGNHIINTLNDIGVDLSYCRQYDGENAYAKVSLENGERVFKGTNKGGISSKKPLDLKEEDIDYIQEHDLVHTSCYSHMEDQLIKLEDINVPISFDFSKNIDDEYLEKVCPYITFSFLSTSHLSEKSTKLKLRKCISYGSDVALATRGEKKAILLYKDNFYYQSPQDIDPLDTLGAGDGFITSFLLEVVTSNDLSKEGIKEGLKKGAQFAAKVCKIQGAFNHGKIYNVSK